MLLLTAAALGQPRLRALICEAAVLLLLPAQAGLIINAGLMVAKYALRRSAARD